MRLQKKVEDCGVDLRKTFHLRKSDVQNKEASTAITILMAFPVQNIKFESNLQRSSAKFFSSFGGP
jgi:hypothetical protein